MKTKNNTIDLTSDQLKEVHSLLGKYLPGTKVWAYGSRVSWSARPNSDLDLVAFTDATQHEKVSLLREAFDESNLPFTVDFFVWGSVPEKFKANIQREYIELQSEEVEQEVFVNEWRGFTIGEFSPFIYGKGLPAHSRNIEGQVPVFGSGGLSGTHDSAYVNEPGIIIGRKGTVGSVIFSAYPFWPIDTTFYITKKDNQDLKFTYYLLQTLRLNEMNADSAVPELNRDEAHSLKIKIPDYEEQQRIASTLGTLDDKIQLNHQTNQTLEQMAQALFKSWFVDFDPVIDKALAAGNPIPDELQGRAKRRQQQLAKPNHKPLPDDIMQLFPSEFEFTDQLGWVPLGWGIRSLYSCADYINGAAYKKFEPNKQKSGLPIIKIAELKAGVTENTGFSKVDMPDKYLIREGDILFSWLGNPDTSIDTFVWASGDAWLNQHIFRVLPCKDISYSYVLALLRYLKPVFAEIARDKQTTGLGHVTVKDLKRLIIVAPSVGIMMKADELFSPFNEQSLSGQKSIHNLVKLRDLLLPKLISGELRLPPKAVWRRPKLS